MLYLLSISGCGNKSESKSSVRIDANIVSSEQSNEYDSYIIYSVDSDINEYEFAEVTNIIKVRAMEGLSAYNRKVDANYEKREIKLEFNYEANWSDFFVETSACPNLLEFRKGDSYTDELVLNNDYINKATSTYDELTSQINDAYKGYVEAAIIQINRLYAQDVSAGIYEQIVSDATVALDLSAKIADVGLEVDSSSIEEIMADLPANYKERYILAINELTEAESWSRSTAWAIMENVPGLGLYDESDLDDPLRLRYAYSLAMYTRKANAADIESGNLSPRDAGMKILDSIEEMDYNPVLILDAADYFKQAGENYTADTLYTLYNDLTAIIEYYQGLRLPNDIPWERFWYFNDFGEFSVDDRNGASSECRQEIRSCAEEALSTL